MSAEAERWREVRGLVGTDPAVELAGDALAAALEARDRALRRINALHCTCITTRGNPNTCDVHEIIRELEPEWTASPNCSSLSSHSISPSSDSSSKRSDEGTTSRSALEARDRRIAELEAGLRRFLEAPRYYGADAVQIARELLDRS